MLVDGILAIVKGSIFNDPVVSEIWMGLFTYPDSGYGMGSMLVCDESWSPDTFYDKWSRIIVNNGSDGYIFMCFRGGTSGQSEPQWIFDPDNRLPVIDGCLVWFCVGRLLVEYNTPRVKLNNSYFRIVNHFDDDQVDILSLSYRSEENIAFEISDVPVTIKGTFISDSQFGGNLLGICKFQSSIYVDSEKILNITKTEMVFR